MAALPPAGDAHSSRDAFAPRRRIVFWQRGVPAKCVEEVTAALAHAHAKAEFAKYRVVQDQLFTSDYDRYLLALEEQAKRDSDRAEEVGVRVDPLWRMAQSPARGYDIM